MTDEELQLAAKCEPWMVQIMRQELEYAKRLFIDGKRCQEAIKTLKKYNLVIK